MISICIPVYNFRVDELVRTLSSQSQLLEVPSEIILIDDCSETIFRTENNKFSDNVKYVQLDKNIGRATIRNLFLKHSKYDNLLFLDCDSIVFADDFLHSYITAIKKHPNSVICGGREYEKKRPQRNKMLRWKYGIIKESKSFEARAENPNKSFMTNNFTISKSIFEKIQFDERLTEYGHEDTLFGFELEKGNIGVFHIDNPILNGHLETNVEYIKNTEKSISNLASILKYTDYNEAVINDITLLRTFYKLYNMRRVILIIFVMLRPLIKYALSTGYVNLYLFDFYKLGTLIRKLNATNAKRLATL